MDYFSTLEQIKALCIINKLTYKKFLCLMNMSRNTFENRFFKHKLTYEDVKKMLEIFDKKIKIIGE